MRIIALPALLLLSGCASFLYAVREYDGAKAEEVVVDGYTVVIQKHPTKNRVTAGQSNWVQGVYDDGMDFRTTEAVRRYIGEGCRILEKRTILHPTYEYEYACD